MANVHGYILAGGASQRFGTDKARVTLDGESLIERSVRMLEGLSISLTIVADTCERYADLDSEVIADTPSGQGPLGGLIAALEHCPDPAWAFVIPCDLKNLRESWFRELQSHQSNEIAAVAFRDDHWQPFIALYHTSILPLAREQLAKGERSLQKLLDRAPTQPVKLPSDWTSPPSINTPDDLAVLRSKEPSP